MASDASSVLQSKDDHYDGVIVDPASLPKDVDTFVQFLRASLAHWKSQLKRGIWLKLPLENANLVHPAIEEGFRYHHAEPDYLMLTYWLPNVPSTLPANASHQVGVGAVVVNNKNEILVVQELMGPTQGSGMWKIPTGVVLQSEDIMVGVQREVKEETGVDTEFIEVLGFRQAHNVAFGKSDLFFLCMLHPLTMHLTLQTTEILDAKWMPLDEFQAQPVYAYTPMLKRIGDIAEAYKDGQYTGFAAELLKFGFRGGGSYFYHNMKDINSYLHQRSQSKFGKK